MGYAAVIKEILVNLKTVIESTTDFTSAKGNVSRAYLKSWQGVTYPVCQIRPLIDDFGKETIGGHREEETFNVEVKVKAIGTGSETDQDSIIGYVGEIVDAIEAKRSLDCTLAFVQAIPRRIVYTLSPTEGSAVFYYAVILVKIKLKRAV